MNFLIGVGAIILYIDIIVIVLPGATESLETLRCNVSQQCCHITVWQIARYSLAAVIIGNNRWGGGGGGGGGGGDGVITLHLLL